MRQLVNFFKNPFDSKDISLAELCAFTTDTVGNLQEHNPAGVHDARITGITSTYSGVESCHGADLASLGTRKARKTAKSLFLESLPAATCIEIDAGHLLPFEEPAAFAAAVREFLAGLDCMPVM